ncbi:glutamate racemase [Rubrobacter radiotolerans]|uniref:Glutamate racemase n=1 Tax=Rubrobacter radiotolerans TaxID=42256 RepID=A0A023X2Z2_RUBRA|nr:glutamate racemase [Rubrobacter radiotolerans]AHY46837.1 glutamate racemase [Rubrobacter radiotolerans]MDX5894243.1 glutamate racemase [Rubrobacter radiotolerans]SMC05541.1 glutamate racemase [Rubrobacter radiotolerans DSM 5868]
MSDPRPIGVFDSGVGGLTVLSEIRNRLPYENTVYFGDTARVPYGVRDLAEVRWFAYEIIRYLITLDVKLIVIACNTATAAALKTAQRSFDVPIIGVIEPGARAAAIEANNRRVGVLATEATVRSRAYAQAVSYIDAGIRVMEQACPAFVPLIEQGITEGPELEAAARGYLTPLMRERVGAVILGCTHYPLISATINRILGPEVRLVSSAGQTALEVGRILSRRGLLRRPENKDDEGKSAYVCSADPGEFAALGSRFLDEEIRAVSPMAVIEALKARSEGNGASGREGRSRLDVPLIY